MNCGSRLIDGIITMEPEYQPMKRLTGNLHIVITISDFGSLGEVFMDYRKLWFLSWSSTLHT